MALDANAGKPADPKKLVNVARLVTAYFGDRPDPGVEAQKVLFGTSGHRGSALKRSFNEWHIVAITQAICEYRAGQGITGPLFFGIDTHALSEPAFASALEVLAGNGVDVMIAKDGDYTPTPVVSHAILHYNKGRKDGLADGILATPSHNPPEDGGFKYNPPHGGPAGGEITKWVQVRANKFLKAGLRGVKRIPYYKALKAATTHVHDYASAYVADLGSVLDMDAIHGAGLKLGVDPLGGASVNYWARIAERYKLNLTSVNDGVDLTFRFMTLDWDGRIRMDPSSKYAMRSLIALKHRFDIAFACDTDADRHGIVTASSGLLAPNQYLAVCIYYLYQHRANWKKSLVVGKTAVSSSIIDRVCAGIKRRVYEVPVGFKFFVDGLYNGTIGFGGEESAGASFLRRNGKVWTTDKDGLIAALLSAEITAKMGKDPGAIYKDLAAENGEPVYERIDAKADARQRAILGKLSPSAVTATELAGEKIEKILTAAPGDGQSLGGLKVVAANGWFAARPSGTEDVYKIYAESFKGARHLKKIQEEAQAIVSAAL